MTDLAECTPLPGPACGQSPAQSLDDGTAMRWWARAPGAIGTYLSPWPQPQICRPEPEPQFCPIPPDVSFLFRMCLNPQRGLSDAAYETAAQRLGVEVAAIKAVAEVETKTDAFDSSGRPTILYERHYFRRLTGGRYNATHADISGPAYGPGKYGPRSRQYERLAVAFGLDRWAALQSVSWGRFQVMGEHFNLLGYQSPQALALAMSRTEQAHLDAFVSYVEGVAACLQGLRAKDWPKFACGYNGPGYAAYHYDTQMADAHARLAAPPPSAVPPVRPPPRPQPRPNR